MSDSFNLEHLRKEAKSLLKLCRSEDDSAMARVRAQLPGVTPEQIKLADIHHALAREHGYRNWAELKQQDAPLSRFLAAVRTGSLPKAVTELSEDPDLPVESIHAACAVGDADAVAHHLDLDPRFLTTEESGWPPLLYACASRFYKLSARHAAGILSSVKLLLDRGADPNTFTLDDPSDPASKISAATRAGNNGAVYRMLIERGAAAEDPRQMAKSVRDKRRLLFQRLQIDEVLTRMSDEDPQFKDELRRRMAPFLHMPGAPPRPAPKPSWLHDASLRQAAMSLAEWVLEKGMDPNVETTPGGNTILHEIVNVGNDTIVAEATEWILQHGADPHFPRNDGLTPYTLAVRSGNTVVADVMRKHGVKIESASAVDEFVGACALHDESAARAILHQHPEVPKIMKTPDHEIFVAAASANRSEDVRFMARVGFDPAGLGESGATALHIAAWNGHVEMVRLLLEFHAPVNIHDTTFGTSPLAWAAHGSKHCPAADEDYCAIVDMLLVAGANRADAINAWGVVPESVASDKVAALLKSNH